MLLLCFLLLTCLFKSRFILIEDPWFFGILFSDGISVGVFVPMTMTFASRASQSLNETVKLITRLVIKPQVWSCSFPLVLQLPTAVEATYLTF